MMNETLESANETPLKGESSDRIRTVTGSTFSPLVLEAEGAIVVEFMSYGCAHCRVIEPVLQQVAELVESKEKVFRVNIAVEPELAESYEIQGTPTLIMFLDGREVGRDEGPHPTLSNVLAVVTQPFEL
jgi:thioredoxin 1